MMACCLVMPPSGCAAQLKPWEVEMSEAVVIVGTRKGLWVGRSDEDRQDWEWSEPQFLMEAVYGTCIDARAAQPRLLVGGTSEHWGLGVYYSDDLGQTWT